MSTPGGLPDVPALGGLRVPLTGRVSDLGYAAGWRLVRALPEFAARNMFDAGARYAALVPAHIMSPRSSMFW